METKLKIAVEEYQCSGCIVGGDISCFKHNINKPGIGCTEHMAGTLILPIIGKIFLGMPVGFNRLGSFSEMKPLIFTTFEDFQKTWGNYNTFNIPVWKYVSKENHTFIRGITPRRNEPFIHIILENCLDKIDCLEITQEMQNNMD
jgi:hypothetical protein